MSATFPEIPIMRLLPVIGCVVLVGCGTDLQRVDVPAVAPTIPAPARTEAVVLEPVRKGVSDAQVSASRLRDELERGQKRSAELSERLRSAEQAGAATIEELGAMRLAAAGLEDALGDAQETLVEQWGTLQELGLEVARKTADVAAGEQEKATLRLHVMDLNERIVGMQETAMAAETARERTALEVAQANGRTEVETRWKWRFFWWAVSVSGLGVVYVLGRVYRVVP